MMTEQSRVKRYWAYPYIVWMALFIVIPLGMVLYYAFTDEAGQFTLEYINSLQYFTNTLFLSVWLGIVATVICLLIAYPFAYILSKATPGSQRMLMMLIMLPMWMNLLLRTYSWMTILEDTGLMNTLLGFLGLGPYHMIHTQGAVILGMVYNFLPYMILPLYTVMSKIDRTYIEAAQDLGGNSIRVLGRVILPLSAPGIVSGITMVFVPSVSTFYISQKLGGGRFVLIGDVIEMQFQSSYNFHLGAALSLVLMVLILLSMAIMNRFSDREEGVLI